MRLLGVSKSYDRFGASNLSGVADFVGGFLADVAPHDIRLEIVSWHRDPGPARPSLEGLFERFEADYRTRPKIRFRSRAKVVDLEYASQLPVEGAFSRPADCHLHFRAICQELLAVLEAELPKSKALRNLVDWPAMKAALARATAALPADPSDVRQLCDQIEGARTAERQRLAGTMAAFGVDWSRFHPKARELLDDPFLWDPADDDAPHGNDTGADLLSAYASWRRRNRDKPASSFLDRLLRRTFGLDPSQPDDMVVEMMQQAEIALPFAQLKIDGEVESAIAAAGIAAIDARLAVLAEYPSSISKLERLREILAEAGRKPRSG